VLCEWGHTDTFQHKKDKSEEEEERIKGKEIR
jgi:hypothetical protein